MCRKQTVRDKRLMNGLELQKDEHLWNQTQDVDGRNSEMRVRMGKLRKDRCQNIRNKVVLATLITRKVYEKSMRSHAGKPVSMKTWR